MVEGETFDVERAHELGIIGTILEAASRDEFLAKVHAYARKFCPPEKAAMAVGRIKRAVQSGAEVSLEQGLVLERELQAELFASADAAEGLAAYVGKRKPVFKAR